MYQFLTCCKRQEEPATHFWSAVFYELHGEVFPESVHILGGLASLTFLQLVRRHLSLFYCYVS